MFAARKTTGSLSDEELAMRARATAALLVAAARSDTSEPADGYRDLLRELLDAARGRLGAPATLSLIVDELVRALDDPAQVEALIIALQSRRPAGGDA